MDIIADLQQELISLIEADCPNDLPESLIAKITLELPKNKEHGCLSTNAAMILAKSFAQKPIILAEKLKSIFNNYIPNIDEINIAGPGFINFRMKPIFWQDTLQKIHHNKQFGQINLGNAQKVNLEFGSPNPTGPLHVGHSRGAIFGDVLANILNFANYDVTRENYINDAGSQIDTLAKSLYLRYEEIATKQAVEIPAGLYPGEYLIDIAKKIFQTKGNEYL
ncbi:MAG: arginine--tRNA ligase, partial [Alphaproteobacteria bacterium]|nr:arginine--tRNA ligase [Alphaproteobacteria bacterium]